MYWKNVQLSQFYLPNSLCLIFKFLFIVPLWHVNLSRKKYLIEASSVRKCIRRSTRCTSQTPNSSVGRPAVHHRLPIRQSAVMPGRRHWVGPRPEKQACYHSEAGFAAYPSADAASVCPMPRLHSTAGRRQAGRAAAAPRRLSRSSRVVIGFLEEKPAFQLLCSSTPTAHRDLWTSPRNVLNLAIHNSCQAQTYLAEREGAIEFGWWIWTWSRQRAIVLFFAQSELPKARPMTTEKSASVLHITQQIYSRSVVRRSAAG